MADTAKHQVNVMDFISMTGGNGTSQRSPTQAQQQSLGSGSGSFAMTREEQERYLLSLLSFGLERVAAEPERLANEIRCD